MWIDACVYASVTNDPKKVRPRASMAFDSATHLLFQIYAQYYIPGIVSTVAVLMYGQYLRRRGGADGADVCRINALSWAQINGADQGFWAESQNTKAK